jgi:hypothetical protein
MPAAAQERPCWFFGGQPHRVALNRSVTQGLARGSSPPLAGSIRTAIGDRLDALPWTGDIGPWRLRQASPGARIADCF